jgi:DIM1 family U5 snRNP protein
VRFVLFQFLIAFVLGTGNNNKINWALDDPQELIDIIETIYRGARKGRGLVISPKDYSTKYRY